ncbi:hypothetical protein INT48_003867 [Thamnidium elegans]|uniref:Post-GPI attachment to proteins factor 3 n=1 Tax=Thamnidium elegans TaxID=101142 RepID=A0A8H7SJL6_9FUNG|nr:hypothetical protein INT48_003867 [Thamnidium elegans]
MSKLNWFIILLFIHICFGSTGNDQAPFQHCLDECVQVSCPTASLNFWLRLFNWNCPEDCRYVCSQQMTDTAQEQGLEIYQYYGKWPFYRLLGMQEPASVFFSIGNGLVHLYYFTRYQYMVLEYGVSYERYLLDTITRLFWGYFTSTLFAILRYYSSISSTEINTPMLGFIVFLLLLDSHCLSVGCFI